MHNWKKLVRERLSPLNLNAAAESDLAEEIAQHLEDRYLELQSGGASEEEAYRSVLSELADMHAIRTNLARRQQMAHNEPVPGDAGRGNFLDDLWRDLRYSARTMGKSPMFVLMVVLTLALGIGANTTVFTVINTLILNPLPVENSSGLVALTAADVTAKSGAPKPIPYADLKDYQAKNQAFAELAGYSSTRVVTWQSNNSSQRLFCELATANYFSTLGLKPAAGRFFLPEEDNVSGDHAVAVVSYRTWQERFGSASDIVGKTLEINHVALTVVGIGPRRFIGVNAIFGPDIWVPAALAEQLLPNELRGALSDRNKVMFQGIGRLKPGVDRRLAQANVATIASDLARAYPATNEGRAVMVRPVSDVVFGSSGTGASPVIMASAGLLAVVGIVLLIACSNVANLLLARAAARRQEMAVRLALGASRQRLMRQLLTESAMLGIISGAAGLFLGYVGLRALFSALPSAANFATPKFDATVFLFALVVSLAASFLFGILPAFKASRGETAETLKDEARTTGRSRKGVTLANVLLVGQVAFSFLLLVTAALFLRSIERAYEIDPGFQTAHLATFMTNPGQAGYSKAQTKVFYKDAKERVERLPGVESVSWSSNLPLWGRAENGLQVEGRIQRSDADKLATIVSTVDLNYFDTAGVNIDRGREFTDFDRETSAPVAIVNEKLAHDFWPAGDAIGKRIQLPGDKQMRQIIAVARTANYSSWAEPAQLCVYIPLEQNYSDGMTLYVRSKGDPKEILVPVERAVHAAGPQVLVSGIRTGRELVDGGLFQAKMGVVLLSVFGLLALGLASIGLYGILAYSINQRKREIGLRMALGAAQRTVLRLILKQGMTLVLTGMIMGYAASLFAARLLTRMLYGVSATDPLSVIIAASVLFVIGLLACYLPARWASRVDPLVALREG